MQTGLLQRELGTNLPWNSWGRSSSEPGCRTRWPDLLWQFYFLFTWKHIFSWGRKKIVIKSSVNKCNENHLYSEKFTACLTSIARSIKWGASRSRRESIRAFLAFGDQQKYRKKLLVFDISTCFHYNFSVSFSWKRRYDMSWLNEMSSECWINYVEHGQGLGIVLIWLLWRKHQ